MPINHFLPCLSCGNPMPGIVTYALRDICSLCGGKSKEDYSDRKKELNNPQRKEKISPDLREERIKKLRERAEKNRPNY